MGDEINEAGHMSYEVINLAKNEDNTYTVTLEFVFEECMNMENLNSVCYVGRIGEIRPIEGADNIELAIVSGWHAITKKGQYNVGDQVIIAITDAVIPLAISDEMGVTGYLRKGQRV